MKKFKNNDVSVSDIIRQRLSSSLSSPNVDLIIAGNNSTFIEVDPRLNDRDLIDIILKGAVAASIWLDMNTGVMPPDADKTYPGAKARKN